MVTLNKPIVFSFIVLLVIDISKNVGNVRLPLPATHTPSEDQAGTPESTFYGGLLDLNESTSKQATMSINDSMDGGPQISTEFAESRAQHDRQSVIGKEYQQLEMDDEDKQSMLDTEPGSTLDDENTLKTPDEDLKEDNPFWYLEVPPLLKRRQPKERRNKTYSAKMGKSTKKVETSHDEEMRNEAMQDEIDGIETMFEEFSQKQKMKDEFSRQVEIIHAEIIDLFMQTGGYRWKEALREELARNKKKRECPLMASFHNICRKIDELDMDYWKKSNSKNNAQHVKKTLAQLEAFGNIRREGAEFL